MIFSVPGAPKPKKRQIEGESLAEYFHCFPIYDELEEAFELFVSFENDANCTTLAEMYQGSAQNNSNVLFVIIGMGISGLIIIDNKIIEGHDKYAEEFGFM